SVGGWTAKVAGFPPGRCCSSGCVCVSGAAWGPSWPFCSSVDASLTPRSSVVADGVPTTRSGLSDPSSVRSFLLFSVMGTLLRGDPDRAGHDQGKTHGPPDEALGDLPDTSQGENATGVRFGLEGLHVGDEFLLLLGADDTVTEQRHGAGTADHGFVDLARRCVMNVRGPAAVSEGTATTGPAVAVRAVGQVELHAHVGVFGAFDVGVVLGLPALALTLELGLCLFECSLVGLLVLAVVPVDAAEVVGEPRHLAGHRVRRVVAWFA